MANNFVDVPRGAQAFTSNRAVAEQIRVAQLLAMSIQAFGSPAQAAALFSEAAELGTPNLAVPRRREAYEFQGLPEDQDALDRFTGEVLRSGLENLERTSFDDASPLDLPRVALWSEVERSRSPEALVAFANFILDSAAGLDRVAAAAVLESVPTRSYQRSREALVTAREGKGRAAAELAAALLGDDLSSGLPAFDTADGVIERGPKPTDVSAAVHGTWARLARERWYAPEGALHQRIRRDCTPNLFAGDDYFRWTGGYSDIARQQGADDFLKWLRRREIVELDTVFAHSHGGNVALSTAAAGIRMKLLVLQHVPALERTSEEWGQIATNVRHVVIMRTRLDYVVLGDGLRTGSAQAFSQSDLPHREIMPHVLDKRGWISHNTFLRDRNWEEWNLAREVRHEWTSA